MRKLFILFLLLGSAIYGQPVETGNLHLTGIPTEIILADDISDIQLIKITNESGKIIREISAEEIRKNKNKMVFVESGNFTLSIGEYKKEVRVLPGFLSLLPPLAAILLALIFRQVVIALVSGIYLGAFFIYDYNPLLAFLRIGDHFVLRAVADESHVMIILFTLLIGGVVGVISKNGGTRGLALQITKLAKTSRSGMVSSWLLGLAIFFDDYANSLIMGNMMRPITDKLNISRAKLAYIVDSTSAPIASLMIISTWIGYEIGLIDAGLKSIGYDVSAYTLFIDSIPYRFYPIAALFLVFFISFTERDFGPMLKSERNARLNGVAENKEDNSEGKKEFRSAKWYNGAIPILIILFGTIGGLIYTGIAVLEADGIAEYGIQEIISNADSYKALLWSSFFAGITAVLMSVFQKILTLNEALEAWQKGLQSMFYACVILVFAWGISMITTEMKTADYIITLISDSFHPGFLPAVVFLICGVISFSTGTSWGTMAIVMPLVIPLAYAVAQNSGVDPYLVITGSVSSVLAGSVFGDHCSPIADTTILSSMASKCNHIEHVRTQLPYSIAAGVAAVLLGEIPSAFGLSPYFSIILILTTLFLVVRFYGKKVTPDNN
ncbi:MAG: sodium:proton antiporter [Melioribacteraceae bacterium]|nr:MAG: sodium:proton antiporter [Melioribacteraceae bacterium]